MSGPPEIDEDAVVYRLYLDPISKVDRDVSPMSGSTSTEWSTETLKRLEIEFDALVTSITASAGHIWQQEPFHLRIGSLSGDAMPYLEGRTVFGDNVEDEWLIVYLLREITIKYPNVIAEVWDNDGQFLLIEAAMHLPRWMKPETSEHRVFLRQGMLHVLPPSLWSECVGGDVTPVTRDDNDDDVDGISAVNISSPQLTKILECVRNKRSDTIASSEIQQCLVDRTSKFPACLSRQLVHVACHVPLSVVYCLHKIPQLISAAVNAFYTRDAIDLKAAATMKHFPPASNTRIVATFTRCLYAQLHRQRFTAPKAFDSHMPSSSHHPDWHAADIGMKLAVGFEILACRYSRHTVDAVSVADVTTLPDWKPFLQRLVAIGYFEGCGPGSRLYNTRLEAAQRHFLSSKTAASSATEDSGSTALEQAGRKVCSMLQGGVPDSLTAMGWEDPSTPTSAEWMDSMEAELEEELRKRESELSAMGMGSASGPDNAPAADMFQTFQSFIDTTSGYQGVDTGADAGKFYSSSDSSDSDDGSDIDAEPTPQSHPLSTANKASCKVVIDPDRFMRILSGDYGSDSTSERVPPLFSKPVSSTSNVGRVCGPVLSTQFGDDNIDDSDTESAMMDSSGEEDVDDDVPTERHEPSVVDYMAAMDAELQGTRLGTTFARASDDDSTDVPHSRDDVDDAVNFVTSVMESVSSQLGVAGPVTNILGELNVPVPTEWQLQAQTAGVDAHTSDTE